MPESGIASALLKSLAWVVRGFGPDAASRLSGAAVG
jgi:hypothetical protein